MSGYDSWFADKEENSKDSKWKAWKVERSTASPSLNNYMSALVFGLSAVVVMLQHTA